MVITQLVTDGGIQGMDGVIQDTTRLMDATTHIGTAIMTVTTMAQEDTMAETEMLYMSAMQQLPQEQIAIILLAEQRAIQAEKNRQAQQVVVLQEIFRETQPQEQVLKTLREKRLLVNKPVAQGFQTRILVNKQLQVEQAAQEEHQRQALVAPIEAIAMM